MSKTVTWNNYSLMYEDFNKTFNYNFGHLLSSIDTYSISETEDVNDLYNLTLESILKMDSDTMDEIKLVKKFLNKWDVNNFIQK